MKKGLQITMIVWAAIGILFGLVFLFAPGFLYAATGLQKIPAGVTFFLALLGNVYIVSGTFVLLAARNPLEHILWVQMAMVGSLLDMLSALYFIIWGLIPFSQAGISVIMNVILLAAFLVFYPWRKAPAG
jgi:hypothetical protein